MKRHYRIDIPDGPQGPNWKSVTLGRLCLYCNHSEASHRFMNKPRREICDHMVDVGIMCPCNRFKAKDNVRRHYEY